MLSFVVNALAFATYPEPPEQPMPPKPPNPCEGAKPKDAQFTNADGVLDESRTIPGYFDNKDCAEMMDTGFGIDLPQAGMDVTDDGMHGNLAYNGTFDPIIGSYAMADPPLCPVNVHWHLGSEHRSAGQYDEDGSGPHPYDEHGGRRLAEGKKVRQGMLCHHYDPAESMFTTPYDWKYCDKTMEVGQTYEVHWPHSAAGKCGDAMWQFQTPFYDGVFCTAGIISLGDNPPFNVPHRVGVEGQVFTIVNTDAPEYQKMDLMMGAWKDSSHWADVATYVGSTTGTSRNNEVCSFYSPITWQVDRTCHMVSAASFDELCRQMKANPGDDLSPDTHAHGSRELVADEWTSAYLYRK